MDKGMWVAIVLLVLATVGFILVQQSGGAAPATPTTSSNTQAEAGAGTQNNPAQATGAGSQDCQTIATEAAQNNQASTGETTSVIKAHFNQTLNQCYYELNIFTDTGNETDIRAAPGDQHIASCTTTSANSLLCQKQDGTTITEPQFKALLAHYLTN